MVPPHGWHRSCYSARAWGQVAGVSSLCPAQLQLLHASGWWALRVRPEVGQVSAALPGGSGHMPKATLPQRGPQTLASPSTVQTWPPAVLTWAGPGEWLRAPPL